MDKYVFKLNNKKYNVTSEKDKKLILKINNIINGNDYDDEKPYRIFLACFREEE